MDLEATAEKLSSRCLSIRKDFTVFTLGPLGSIRVDPDRLKVIQCGISVDGASMEFVWTNGMANV